MGLLVEHFLARASVRLNRDANRHPDTCCRAANWVHVGTTQGRGKLDRNHTARLPREGIWLYPLAPDVRRRSRRGRRSGRRWAAWRRRVRSSPFLTLARRASVTSRSWKVSGSFSQAMPSATVCLQGSRPPPRGQVHSKRSSRWLRSMRVE
ncbi:MAG: DUF4338 domain-containing protein [Planctomycetes bacterium]|nr:DUF4338 domain-containing protein [Planctomycetota bacterium]